MLVGEAEPSPRAVGLWAEGGSTAVTTTHEPKTDFDHHSEEFAKDPFTVCEHLRKESPVSWTDAHEGYWVLSTYDLVAEAFRDYETFSSASGAVIPDLSLGNTHIPVTVDPPEFFGYRQLLTPKFSKGAIAPLEPVITEVVRHLVEAAKAKGSWDFVHDMAEIVPGTVMLTLLGMSPDRRQEFTDRMARGIDNAGTDDPELLAQIGQDREWLLAQVRSEISDRREHPTDDLFSYLIHADLGDRKLTEGEIIDIVMVLFVAGFHTTSSAFSAAIVYLGDHPEDRQAIIENPDLLPSAIEEIMRVYPPATGMARTLKKDTTMDGVTMFAGEKVLLSIASANRDENAFSHPDTVDITDDSKHSLAFGWGIHRCLGIHLARMILRIELSTVLEIIPDYIVDRDRVTLAPDIAVSYLYSSIPAHLPA